MLDHSMKVDTRFNAHLSEFWLPIRSEIFVAETARKLVVSWYTTCHEDLLILLRALRQSVSLTTPPSRHQKLASTLWS
jgi:hypothetical protein